MALSGTFKDFGIADILQLIGQQQKTGMLHLSSKDQQVRIGFKDGAIVRVETASRKKNDLIGAMLVEAEIITASQLEEALETQRRTLKRLGDVLVSMNMITAERFKQMVQLQTTETLYKLFSWKAGKYEFEQTDVEYDHAAVTPLRAESVLMEGFRLVDEWPVIRKKITSQRLLFQHLKPLPPRAAGDSLDAGFEREGKGDFQTVGEAERTLYGLIRPYRDVSKLVALSCLGEFETCKALTNLLNAGYIGVLGETPEKVDASAVKRPSRLALARQSVARMLVGAAVVIGLGLLASQVIVEWFQLTGAAAARYSSPAAERLLSRQQLVRIEAALEVYRLEKGNLPDSLESLVLAGLLRADDLHYPWTDPYHYRKRAEGGFVLLPPLR